MAAAASRYRRILLKLSGEALAGDGTASLDAEMLRLVAGEVAGVMAQGVQVAIVVGGGNFVRGDDLSRRIGIHEVTGHNMGMLATVINALALQDALEKLGCYTRVQSAIDMQQVAEPYIRRRAVRHLEKGRVVIFAAGTGNPYFTTDTAATLRAMEIHADVIMKATKVDGVYTADPKKDPSAQRFRQLSYMDCLRMDLRVMDAAAISLCRDNHLPLLVFDLTREGNIKRAVLGEPLGTLVGEIESIKEKAAP